MCVVVLLCCFVVDCVGMFGCVLRCIVLFRVLSVVVSFVLSVAFVCGNACAYCVRSAFVCCRRSLWAL